MIQIFGTKKCNNTKKAQRFFKERGIKIQFIDLREREMSRGELQSVISAGCPEVMRTPVVRLGRLATVGYEPDTWKKWLEKGDVK